MENEQPTPKVETNTLSLIDQANAAAERIESANKQLGELLARQERQRVETIISGKAEAGVSYIATPEERAITNARNFLKGTGYDLKLFPEKVR